jgi:enterochelin esterase-like enzyme
MKTRWMLAALTPSSRRIALIPAFWLLCALVPLPLASAQEGTVEWEWDKITSPALAGNLIGDPDTRSFAIYLPPSYNTSDKHYPVLYELGAGGGHIGIEVGILQDGIDLMIRNRDIGEMIVVFPDVNNRFGGSRCLSSPTIGDYETYITTDLVNHIDANYRTIANRESRGIIGSSGTGAGAMHLALKFPEVF